MTAYTVLTETTEQLTKRYIREVDQYGVAATTATRDQLVRHLRDEGLLDERSIQHLILCLQPGGEKEVLPGEAREQAVARLMRHYGWDERTASLTLYLADGWSDVVPVDDDGTPLPFFRVRAEEADEGGDDRPAAES